VRHQSKELTRAYFSEKRQILDSGLFSVFNILGIGKFMQTRYSAFCRVVGGNGCQSWTLKETFSDRESAMSAALKEFGSHSRNSITIFTIKEPNESQS